MTTIMRVCAAESVRMYIHIGIYVCVYTYIYIQINFDLSGYIRGRALI